VEEFLGESIAGCECALDLAEALMDGVVLCKVVNRISPAHIPHIHIEPVRSAVPISLKVRKNVDAFLEYCRQVGISPKKMCTALDILQQKETTTLVMLLEQLIRGPRDADQVAYV
jgi:hypothetical protein